jgi:DNA-binding transcriptional regulator GbsR (MarR family)
VTFGNVGDIIAGLAGGGGIVALTKAFTGRRKRKIDEAKDIASMAHQEAKDVRTELEEIRSSIRQFRRALDAHSRWDRDVIRRLELQGVTDIPAPPEIWI